MATLRGIGRLWLAAAAAGLSVIMAQPAVEAWTVKGDAAAWAEIVAALKKQNSMSYRGKVTGGGTGIVEFAPPASEHSRVSSSEGYLIEDITVGNTRWWMRQGKWDCANPDKLSPEQMAPFWDKKGE